MFDYSLATVEFLGLVFYEIFIALLFGAFVSTCKHKRILYIIYSLFPLLMMSIFRDASIGNDTKEYLLYFEIIENSNFQEALDGSRFEIGYVVLNYILSRLTDNSYVLLITTGFFVFTSLSIYLNKWCSALGLFTCLMIEMLFIDNWMSIIRQTIALFVLLLGFDYLVYRNKAKFCLTVLGASLFHDVALAFFLAWPIVYWFNVSKQSTIENNELIIQRLVKVFLFCGLLIVFWDIIINSLLTILPSYKTYINDKYMDGVIRIAVITKIIVYVLMITIPLFYKKKAITNENRQYRNILSMLSILNIIFLIIAIKATLLMRFTDIFSFFALADYVENINDITDIKRKKQIILITLVAFGLYGLIITLFRTPEWQTTYPFKWQTW